MAAVVLNGPAWAILPPGGSATVALAAKPARPGQGWHFYITFSISVNASYMPVSVHTITRLSLGLCP